jgi:hypothetical protein
MLRFDTRLAKYKKRETEPSRYIELFEKYKGEYQNCIEYYVDAAYCVERNIGRAALITKFFYHLTDNYSCISSTHAELVGILSCIYSIYSHWPIGGSFVIYTDSLFAFKQIKYIRHTIPTFYRITLMWIPSHVGIIGNECADALAKLP